MDALPSAFLTCGRVCNINLGLISDVKGLEEALWCLPKKMFADNATLSTSLFSYDAMVDELNAEMENIGSLRKSYIFKTYCEVI